jgi:hypothetical protein
MDDYEEVRKKFKVKRFAQKQRIKKKLERIKASNESTKKQKNTGYWATISALCFGPALLWALFCALT